MKRKLQFGGVAALLILCVTSAFGHHSNSMYDRDQQTTLKATILSYELSNPHAQISFETRDSHGNMQKWTAEGPNPNQMNENGWKKDTLKPGDHVTIVGNLARNGSASIRLRWITLPNGKDLFAYTN